MYVRAAVAAAAAAAAFCLAERGENKRERRMHASGRAIGTYVMNPYVRSGIVVD